MARMRMISVRQPWASAILADGPNRKNVENRSYRARPGWLGIHASSIPSTREDFEQAILLFGPDTEFELGVFLGAVWLVESVPMEDLDEEEYPWAWGPWCWILEHPIRAQDAEKVRLRGNVGFWTAEVPDSFLRRLEAYSRKHKLA